MGTSRSYLSVFPVIQVVEPLVVICLMNFIYKAGGSKIFGDDQNGFLRSTFQCFTFENVTQKGSSLHL